MNLRADRDLTERIIQLLPTNEEDLALTLCTSREHVASLCATLERERRIVVDEDWDTPRHWRAA